MPVQLIYKGKMACCHPQYPFPSTWHITHSPNHWANEDTMLWYIDNIIVPHVERVREEVGVEKTALMVMDNFKGHTTTQVTNCLEESNILVCWFPPNITDRLQPMDISINKPVKESLKRQFEKWSSKMVTQQLDGRDIKDLEQSDT